MGFEKYFMRVQDSISFDEHPYSRQISPPIENRKDLNLFKDCFSNHTEAIAISEDKLEFQEESKSRYIQRDSLSAFFIKKVYQPPALKDYDSGQEIEYADFLADYSESSFSKKADGFRLGSNRIRYIVGDVGQGKTALMKRMYCDLHCSRESIDKYRALPVYMDLEKIFNYGEEPIDLQEKFESYLISRIEESISEIGENIEINNGINPSKLPTLYLKSLIRSAKENKIRFLIFIDNLDFYHYYYARYCFFEQGNKKQTESILNNISWLISWISDPEALGNLGLNILVAIRSYVYDDIVTHRQGTRTDTDTSLAISLNSVQDVVITSSRVELYSEAVKVISSNLKGANNSLAKMLQPLRLKFTSQKISRSSNHSPLSEVYRLGQHGYRSLVHFISSLNLTPSHEELFERFFDRQVSSLYILYYNNMYLRYSQEKNHFPNMFLVDCTAMDGSSFPQAHQPHMHTYWLKYFILRYIYHKRNIGVKLGEILSVFRDMGRYDDHLVRHVVGSLCTANEFRCAEIKLNQSKRSLEGRKILPTTRGEKLVGDELGDAISFNFLYLRTITDDKWISYPVEFFDRLFRPSDYSHLFDIGPTYWQNSIKSVFNDAKKVLHFLQLLSSAYAVEIKQQKPELHEFLLKERLIPDLATAQEMVIRSTEGLLKALNDRDIKGKIEILRDIRSNHKMDEYKKFFMRYFKDVDAKVQP